jgi:hypothetical protein
MAKSSGKSSAKSGSNPPFRNAVLPGTWERGPDRTDGHRPHCNRDLQAVLAVPIKDEESGGGLVGESLPLLLHNPCAGGMPRDIEMQHASAIMTYNEEAIECESRSVRTHDRLWIHDNESLFPSRPEPSSQNPQELIECRQPWPGMFSFQCRELLAKGQVFKEQSLTSLEEARDCAYK